MLSADLTYTIAQQQIAELHRAAAHHRLVHAAREPRRPHTNAGSAFLRRLRRRLAAAQPASR